MEINLKECMDIIQKMEEEETAADLRDDMLRVNDDPNLESVFSDAVKSIAQSCIKSEDDLYNAKELQKILFSVNVKILNGEDVTDEEYIEIGKHAAQFHLANIKQYLNILSDKI